MIAMDTELTVTGIERVDDIPLLLAQLSKMGVASLLDEHFPVHGNWQGLSLGEVAVVWLASILSEGDHRLSVVQGWAAGLLMTLRVCLGRPSLRALDVSDDRLGLVLERLGGEDTAWENYEHAQNARLLRVYDLQARRVRLDSTTAKSYVGVSEDGLFQFGHSKEHRPDVPQLKISQSTLDPLGLPLSTTVVSGEQADDPLYVPEIRRVQATLGQRGVLYVGDCKMAALATRAYLAGSADHYVCPLSGVQMPPEALQAVLAPVWSGAQTLTPVYRAPATDADTPERIANGFASTVTLTSAEGATWIEQRLVVQSLQHAAAQQARLDQRLHHAERDLAALNQRGRGRKQRDESQTRAAVEAILQRHQVTGLLRIDLAVETHTTHTRAYRDRPAREVTAVNVAVTTRRDPDAYAQTVRTLGWRVFASNDLALTVSEAVLAYREQYLIERGFNRLRGRSLGLTPLYLSSTTRIQGLVRLLAIALRVLCLVEFTVRNALQIKGETLDHLYAGNPKRATARPTTEMMLATFTGICLIMGGLGNASWQSMTPLNAVQTRILVLSGFSPGLYENMCTKLVEDSLKMGEP